MNGLVLERVDVLGRGVRDLAILDGRMVDPREVADARRVDCSGLIALPALVDPHTHLRDPGAGDAEDIASGLRAAAIGGYGAVCALANTTPVADHVAVVEYEYDKGRRTDCCDLVVAGAVTRGLAGEELADIAGMAASRAQVRLFSDDGKCVARSDVMRDALLAIRAVGGVLAQHAQDPLLTRGAQMDDSELSRSLGLVGWPGMAESVIIARDVVMAGYLDARVHVYHLSTAMSVEIVRWAKAQGLPVTAEVTPHHLHFTHRQAATGDPVYKVNPPLRSPDDVQAVRDGLADGTIDMVGTDHAPHPAASKAGDWCEASMGMLGLETALPVVVSAMADQGDVSWARVADWMASAPARLLGLEAEHGGDLSIGRGANVCLIDPARRWELTAGDLHSIARNSPYVGETLGSRVVGTILRGRVTHDLDARFGDAFTGVG